ncbi:MAG: FliH/SctL family protein [Candidatus Eremiobacteraeota bacterium]|nr:FliH/SctL family protein [Candidatus Eremiobacteraeota bacterium]
MGKIVKGATLGSSNYLLSVPIIRHPELAPEPAVDFTMVETGDIPVENPEPQAPSIDWDALHAQAQEITDNASRDAQSLLNDAQARSSAIIAEANARSSQIELDARAAGLEQGKQAGLDSANTEMEEMLSTMRGLVEMARVERHKIILSAEPEIVRLATLIAERVLHKQIALDPMVVVDMTKAAISRLLTRETVTVRINPADIETVREHKEQILGAGDIEHMRIIEDQRVDRGGVLVETQSGTIDAKVATQLREAKRVLQVEDAISMSPPSEPALFMRPAKAG